MRGLGGENRKTVLYFPNPEPQAKPAPLLADGPYPLDDTEQKFNQAGVTATGISHSINGEVNKSS